MNNNKNVLEFSDFIDLTAAAFLPMGVLFVIDKRIFVSSQISAIILVLFSVYIIWCFHIILKSKRLGIGSWFQMRTFGTDLVWSIIIFPLVFGVYLFMAFLTSRIWNENILLGNFSLNPNPILAVLALGLFFPVAEEVVFRGAIYGYLEEKFSAEFSMVITSGAFAVVHPFEDWMKTFVLGMLLNLLYYKRKTLTVPATIHVMVNLLYLSIMYFYASRT